MTAPSSIGIFGGSFNPPHTAHVLVCQFALCVWPLQRILVIPTYKHPLHKPLEPYEHRLAMARLAFASLSHLVEVSTLEQEMGGVSYTIDTVRELRRRYPQTQLHLILGSDILQETCRWKDYDLLQREAPPLVVPRLETTPISAGPHAPSQFFLPAISSTEIRDKLRRGQDTGFALPYQVRDYISQHGLYRSHVPDPPPAARHRHP